MTFWLLIIAVVGAGVVIVGALVAETLRLFELARGDE